MTKYYIHLNKSTKLKKIIDGLRRSVRTQGDLNGKDLADYYREEYIKPLIVKLKKYPPVRDRRDLVKWKTDKQKRYMMWLWRKGRIKLPYSRNNDLKNGWEGDVQYNEEDEQITIDITNKEEKSQFIVGKVGFSNAVRDIKKYENPIQPFHKKLWKPANQIIRPVTNKIRQDIADKSKKKLQDILVLFDKS